jgi:ElaB/YqjD/DUF883 family membrane-anchored ribosome-binding protein
MKIQKLLGCGIATLSLAVFTVGCGDSMTADRGTTNDTSAEFREDYVVGKPVMDDNDKETDGDESQNPDEDLKSDEDVSIDDVTDTVRQFVKQEKAEYEAEIREEMKDVDAYLTDVKEEVTERQELQQEIKELRAQLDEQLKELNEDSAEAWDELREKADSTAEELQAKYEELKTLEQDKPQPNSDVEINSNNDAEATEGVEANELDGEDSAV